MSGNLNINTNTAQRKRAGFSAEYQAVYDAFTIKPSASIAVNQNIFWKKIVDDGVYAKLDVWYTLAGHTNTNGESLINWLNPGTLNATAVNAPAFVALEGFTGDGATSYIDTNYNPTSNAINYALLSMSCGVYIRTNSDEVSRDIGAGNRLFISSRISGAINTRVNDSTNTANIIPDSLGLYVAVRVEAPNKLVYKNKTQYTNAVASTSIPNENIYVLGHNVGGLGLPSTKQTSLAFIGGGLTQTDVNNLTDAFETYMDSNGRGVIP